MFYVYRILFLEREKVTIHVHGIFKTVIIQSQGFHFAFSLLKIIIQIDGIATKTGN